MSTVTVQPAGAGTSPAYKVTGVRVLRMEWAKLWSLRSAWITLGLSLLFLVVFGLISAATFDPGGTVRGPGQDADDAVGVALGGLDFAQLAIGVLGVLITAGEYSTGMIRSTLAAVPTRLPVLWSKAAGFAVVAVVVAAVGAFVSFLAGKGFLDSGTALSLSDTGVVRSLLGAALYLALVGVLGVALGALLRSAAGGIGVLVLSLMLLPALAGLLPNTLENHISPYLPGNAGGSIFALHQAGDSLSPGAGLAVFAGWVTLAMAGAALRLTRSDA
ncbi:ABC transporter permease [Streptomyces sp. NPDC005859]|uniref:ABC transporter permease n=1 Tax=Streptomyces sp. NPDC005859 TaxID=3157170 RepID=UPI0033D71DC1